MSALALAARCRSIAIPATLAGPAVIGEKSRASVVIRRYACRPLTISRTGVLMNQPPQGGYPPQPQGAYPQRPAQYPQQPAQYPQAPGQYPPGPQAYPPQYPGGAPYPGKRGPNKGLGVLKVLIGLCLAMSFGG